MKNIFITGINSDIGTYLARKFLKQKYVVYGTFRSNPGILLEEIESSGGKLYQCDFSKQEDIKALIQKCKSDGIGWNIFISSVGNMKPIGKFFDIEYEKWEQSIQINALSQLQVLHGIINLKCSNATVLFFAGGGTNNAFTNYSAYCISKILLIKMCELLDDENPDINILIAGPGMIGTKIHKQTLEYQKEAGDNYKKTVQFLDTEGNNLDKNLERIYEFIMWAEKNGKEICSGRNFSIVHDSWDNEHSSLIYELQKDTNMYKLRRNKNGDK